MGKNLRQQHRGRGTIKYRARKQAYRIRLTYPKAKSGKGEVIKLLNSPAHTAPLALIKAGNENFFNLAATGMFENQFIDIGENAPITAGNIVPLHAIPIGTDVYNIETIPFSGGKIVRTSGLCAKVIKKTDSGITVLLPSKMEKTFSGGCRATIGTIAGGGRTEKPIVKAGKRFYMMIARGKPYPFTSPIKMNAVCHPFGSGRGKNIGKPKTAPRFAPPGRKVGLIHPRRTGRRKK